jgi:hypothetical protein
MDEDWDALNPDNFPDIDPAGGLDDALIFGDGMARQASGRPGSRG